MKIAIYYFTGTGNSLAVARDLAGELVVTNKSNRQVNKLFMNTKRTIT